MARTCGDCSLCCKLLEVEELGKPANVWCAHFGRGVGCGIHETRPAACRDFYCQWLLNEALGPEWRPSKCKMVVVADGPKLVVHVEPGSPGPWAEPFLSVLRRVAARGLVSGEQVLVIERGRTKIVLPEREVDFGVLGDDERIVLVEVPAPMGRKWDAVRMKKDEAERFAARIRRRGPAG